MRPVADEVVQLRRWKAEATAVLAEWDEVHELLGRPGLGLSKAGASRALIEEMLAAEAVRRRTCRRFEG